MTEAGSPGAKWISTKATVATTSATGISASSRRTTYVFTAEALLVEPNVPEEQLGRRLEAAHLLAQDVQREVVAELDPADVLVEEHLHALPDRAAPLGIELGEHRLHQPVLLLLAPPARPVAVHRRGERRLVGEGEARREDVPQLRLVAPLDERRPVDHLEVHREASLLELLLGHERILVHPLIFLRRDPAHGLARVASLLQQLLRLRATVLVVRLAAGLRVPAGLLDVEEARIEPVEILVAEAGGHDRLHVERGLERLAQPLVGHHALLVVQHRGGPAVGLDDGRDDRGNRLDPVVLVLLDLLREVIVARLDAREAHGDVRHGDEEDLVHVGGALAAVAVGRLAPRDVLLEARQFDVAVRLVLDEAERPGTHRLLDLVLAGRVHDLLREDRGAVVRARERRQEHARRLFHVDHDGQRVLRLHRLDVLPHRLARARHLPPAHQRGHDVGRGHLLAGVELDALAEADRVASAAVGHRVALGEHRHDVEDTVVRVEGLDRVPSDLLRDHRRRPVDVQRRRLADHSGLEDTAGPLRRGGLGGDDEEGEGEQRDESAHGTLLRRRAGAYFTTWRTAASTSSAFGVAKASSGGLNGIGTLGPATRAIGASRSSKHSSMITHASHAPVDPRIGPSSAMTTRCVRRTESASVARSRGTRLRGSTTSPSMPSSASRRAAARLSCTIRAVAMTVTSRPGRLTSAEPSGTSVSASPTSPVTR